MGEYACASMKMIKVDFKRRWAEQEGDSRGLARLDRAHRAYKDIRKICRERFYEHRQFLEQLTATIAEVEASDTPDPTDTTPACEGD
jgi:hypothetical protein